MDPSAYPYTPLNLPHETRIFTLIPGPFQSPIAGRLSPMSISSPPMPYSALSYCWSGGILPKRGVGPEYPLACATYGHAEDGSEVSQHYYIPWDEVLQFFSYDEFYIRQGYPFPSGKITVDGVEVTIGGELYRALLRLRKEDEERRIWIDSLCINQGDMAERNEHVRMMGQVYAGAEKVEIWLGEETGREMALMETFNTLIDVLYETLEREGAENERAVQSGFFADERMKKVRWEVLGEFVDRAWVSTAA